MTINDDEFARAFMAFLTHMSNRDSAGPSGTQLGGVVGEHLGADPQTVEMVREKPYAALGAAVGIGFLVGHLFSASRTHVIYLRDGRHGL